ncbi:hypothetical protein BOTBODRAFT_31969 [Botryobasidium botryosum FD-172 SS1]|uniref:non-specific serine/threonine protein kinase n=1 Tax=Botryobasidium botryosum (strain FD-172 SS1) TaxID=930990 RepID=A0A067MKU7_BOTB1|nr:hypothetical protein BOTBODRAFT_31969 [Botryobasidium botryosum FD-172 SS1]
MAPVPTNGVDHAGTPPSPPPSPTNTKATASRSPKTAFQVQNLQFKDTLGEGSYSSVVRARDRVTKKTYAVKIMDKQYLRRRKKTQTAIAEREALAKLTKEGHPGVIKMYWAYQDQQSLYFVLELASNGELKALLSKWGSLNLPCARYYTAQIVDAVQWMHSKGVIHRDMKPENVLLDPDMRVKITDFGTAKVLDPDAADDRATTWVGTAQYLSPELLISKYACKSSDLWAIGCILYQCIAGDFAFHGPTEYLTMQRIRALEYTIPEWFDPAARDLVEKLLILDPQERIGAGPSTSSNPPAALRAHPFFESIAWGTLWTDAPPLIESGHVKPPPPVSSDSEGSEDGDLREWGTLVSRDDISWEQEQNSAVAAAAAATAAAAVSVMGAAAVDEKKSGIPMPRISGDDLRSRNGATGAGAADGMMYPPPPLSSILQSETTTTTTTTTSATAVDPVEAKPTKPELKVNIPSPRTTSSTVKEKVDGPRSPLGKTWWCAQKTFCFR